MTDKMKELLNGIGAIAEMTSLYYSSLIDNGVDKTAALAMTNTFVQTILRFGMPNG